MIYDEDTMENFIKRKKMIGNLRANVKEIIEERTELIMRLDSMEQEVENLKMALDQLNKIHDKHIAFIRKLEEEDGE